MAAANVNNNKNGAMEKKHGVYTYMIDEKSVDEKVDKLQAECDRNGQQIIECWKILEEHEYDMVPIPNDEEYTAPFYVQYLNDLQLQIGSLIAKDLHHQQQMSDHQTIFKGVLKVLSKYEHNDKDAKLICSLIINTGKSHENCTLCEKN
eukprot:209708_1